MVAIVPVKRRRAQNLRRLFEAAKRDRRPDRFFADLQEGLTEKHIDVGRDHSIRYLFEEFVEDGHELVETFNPRNRGSVHIVEAADVSTADFANITGQIVYSRVLDSFENPQFLWSRLVETIPTEFDGEKIPGIGEIGDQAESIMEGENYPLAGVSEEWVTTPETTKRGLIVPVTKEAIFFDRTGLVLRRAGQVGHSLGLNKEKRILDVVLGITTTYRRNGGAAQATYGDSHSQGDFDNLVASNALVDWTDIEAAILAFSAITDPNTGEPIDVMPNMVIVPPALLMTARRILNATQIQYGPGGSTTNATVATSNSPVAGMFGPDSIASSQYVKNRTSSDTTWFIGEPQRAFGYMENWPITVIQAPDNSHDEFHRDIVAQYKSSERGAAAVLEPRRMIKCTG